MSGMRPRWSRLPPKAALFGLAALALAGGGCLVGEELHFRARSTPADGTVVDHDNKGRPVVQFPWAGESHWFASRGPDGRLPVGSAVTVFVPPEGPSSARLGTPMALLFLPGWACLMLATFFLPPATPGGPPDTGRDIG